jgi:chemotaxis protein MotA
MEFSVLLGYVAAILAIIFGIVFSQDGLNFSLLSNFVNAPSIFITVGGTLFTLMAAFPFKTFRHLPKHIKMVFGRNQKDPYEYVEIISEL